MAMLNNQRVFWIKHMLCVIPSCSISLSYTRHRSNPCGDSSVMTRAILSAWFGTSPITIRHDNSGAWYNRHVEHYQNWREDASYLFGTLDCTTIGLYYFQFSPLRLHIADWCKPSRINIPTQGLPPAISRPYQIEQTLACLSKQCSKALKSFYIVIPLFGITKVDDDHPQYIE